MKTSALRRRLVLLGLIARDQTTRFTGGYDGKNKPSTGEGIKKRWECNMSRRYFFSNLIITLSILFFEISFII